MLGYEYKWEAPNIKIKRKEGQFLDIFWSSVLQSYSKDLSLDKYIHTLHSAYYCKTPSPSLQVHTILKNSSPNFPWIIFRFIKCSRGTIMTYKCDGLSI